MQENNSRERLKLTSLPNEIFAQSLNNIVQDTARTIAIEEKEIVNNVMKIVGEADSEIKMTMELAEEIKKPLPSAYHQLLSTKLDEGVQITRVGFGAKTDFQEILKSHGFSSPNFKFAYNPNLKEYQRMILIDGNALFFRHNDIFYKTTDASIIEQFQNYFNRVL